MSMDQAFKIFLDECAELLQDMEDRLLGIDPFGDTSEDVNAVFRAAHTIKGSAGLFGLDAIVEFTHVSESVLDKVRAGELPLDDALVSLMLLCKDHIALLVDSIEGGREVISEDDRATGDTLVAQLNTYLDTPSAESALVPAVEESPLESVGGGIVDNDNWHISVHFGLDVLRNGMDPLSFIRFLGTFGEIVSIAASYDNMPDIDDMDPESCYLGFDINFKTDVEKTEIEGAFEFVRDDCVLRILPPHSRVADFVELIDALDEPGLRIGEMLIKCGTLTKNELEQVLELQNASVDEADDQQKRPIGEMIVENGMAQPAVVEAALEKQRQVQKSVTKQSQSVRVDADKLDSLVNLVGELVIAAAGVNIEVRDGDRSSMLEAAETLIRLVEEVRDGTLNLRMVQIGDTFNRFQRVVRDVSKELGKSINLKVSGGDTELDKTVVEKIGDPLMHLVRNSMDHGIELPEERLAQGKPEQGTLQLNAYHESGSIVIEVSDDGAGLKRDRIMAKAVEKGIVTPDQQLTDQEVYRLIFEAGFSTAEQVSNISGRGVGMDVVRRNIESLRGSIDIDSTAGVGTTLRIRLPLTLAIIDGFLMGVGKGSFVVPLDIVEECRELTESERSSSQDSNYINLRGEVLPFIRLREHFQQTGNSGRRENIVVIKYGTQKAGLVVDQLMGELQTVIKPLGAIFQSLEGISGSTILGSGEVALILDAPALIAHAVNQSACNTTTVHQTANVTH